MAPGGKNCIAFSYALRDNPIRFRLLVQADRAAASRTFCTAGSSNPMRIAMIAITTNSSLSVKARFRRVGEAGMAGSGRPTGRLQKPGAVPVQVQGDCGTDGESDEKARMT